MSLDIGPHLNEAELEQYSMGILRPERIPPFEEHLMACAECQDQLLEMEAYVNAVRSVSPKLRPADSPKPAVFWNSFGWLRWAGAVAAVVTLLFAGRMWLPHAPTGPPALVLLQASRGAEIVPAATANAGQPLLLQIDSTEISPAPSYRVEVVASTGAQVAASQVAIQNNKFILLLDKGLPAGRYYARLYGGSELLREYGLRIR